MKEEAEGFHLVMVWPSGTLVPLSNGTSRCDVTQTDDYKLAYLAVTPWSAFANMLAPAMMRWVDRTACRWVRRNGNVCVCSELRHCLRAYPGIRIYAFCSIIIFKYHLTFSECASYLLEANRLS